MKAASNSSREKAISFRTKLLLVILVLVGCTLLTSTIAVLTATNANVTKLLKNELETSERVFSTLLDDNRIQLKNRAELLADDFAFRDAVATNERETIISVLANHANRVDANLVALISPKGEVEVSTHDQLSISEKILGQLDTIKSFDTLTIADNKPYMVVFVPVMAPDLIGWAGLGFEINLEHLNRLKQITHQDITLAFTTNTGEINNLSTLNTLPTKLDPADSIQQARNVLTEMLEEQHQLTHPFVLLDEEKQKIIGVLSHSLSDALSSYGPMRFKMVIISLAALAFAAVSSYFVARGITQPIKYLEKAAHRISNGDYSKHVHLDSSLELNALGNTLDLMQQTVSEREERIRYQSRHDMLTKLPNRFSIFNTITNRIAEKAPSMQFGLGLLNLGNLALLTDYYGSEFSDHLLQKFAESLSKALRRGDIVARVGDVQFLIFFDGLNHEHIFQVVEKLQNVVEAPITNDDISVKLEANIGFVLCPQHGNNFDDLLRRAQIAQKHCRSPKRFYSTYEIGQDEIHLRQIKVTNRLQHAIASRDFNLVYQPKFDLRQNTVTQVETLIRWSDPEINPVYPDEFITLAEQSGDISRISSIVVEMLIEQLHHWKNSGLDIMASFNLSGLDIVKKDFISEMIDRINASGIPSNQLVIEITESMMMTDLESARENLEMIRRAGLKMSIDDFGTGFSSLSQLKMLPVSELKIDKSLVQNLPTNDDDQKIVKSTIEMAHHLGLSIVAEGVEDSASVEILMAMECDALQGYYLGKPMSAETLFAWMKNPPRHILDLMADKTTQQSLDV